METIKFSYEGKIVVITGAATGIGRATAIAFARNGAQVVIGDVSPAAEETVGLIEKAGGKAIFIKTDVTNSESVQNFISIAVKNFGRIDMAFNNAGILPPTAKFAEMEEADFDKTIAVDLKGVFLCMKYEIAAMLASGGGAIVNTASVAGVVADPGMAPYAAAKHGVVGLTKSAALDYASQNIRINAIAPGLIRTPMTERWLADPAIKSALMANSPMARPAEPEEIAYPVLFLCSPQASFMNGSVTIIDGGQTAH
ncbi:SDR family NAD(P)-dependent oxidoreductase [Pedobacter sp. L105]|uniref:SDR family NAD(P)-dependent oxidoreductase n=1 Tax=Pedobacter sp. L105 TaxID=1641871 RepID=UPI00131E757F|nr:SDR family oxidoreductase [Pedobacter sp. L105]